MGAARLHDRLLATGRAEDVGVVEPGRYVAEVGGPGTPLVPGGDRSLMVGVGLTLAGRETTRGSSTSTGGRRTSVRTGWCAVPGRSSAAVDVDDPDLDPDGRRAALLARLLGETLVGPGRDRDGQV